MLKVFDKVFFLFLIGIVVALVFSYLGWVRILVVQTGSMQPEMPVNSLLLVVPQKSVFNTSEVYKAGEVISFHNDGKNELITHRVFDVTEKGGEIFYRTKGDANDSLDLQLTGQKDVLGRVVFSLPLFGLLLGFLSSFLGLFLLVILPASFVILHEVITIQNELKKIKVSKAGMLPLGLILFVALTIPTAALFSNTVALENNSLSTKNSFLADHLVINEVYYQVDPSHGVENSQGGASASNTNTGIGSTNIATASASFSCTINQNNSSSVNNNININTNTGGNSASGNLSSGSASASASISNDITSNFGNCQGSGQNNEWVELYNPTNQDIELKNWSLTDNSGQTTKITANKIIKAGGFALLAKSSSTWVFWNENQLAVKVNIGTIGDGLDNLGDRLILKNPAGQTVDQLSYGSDTSVFNPAIPLVSAGNSLERSSPGFDNDLPTDFVEKNPPTPGN